MSFKMLISRARGYNEHNDSKLRECARGDDRRDSSYVYIYKRTVNLRCVAGD